MPNYDYHCPDKGETVEVVHGMNDRLQTWGELCERSGHPLGDTPAGAAVYKLLSVPRMAFPKGNSALRNQGFTKLVRRDKGVYENVTAGKDEKRYVSAGDSDSLSFTDKIRD